MCYDCAVVELVALVMDARSPRALAHFWARALEWRVNTAASGEIELLPTDSTSFRIVFRSGAGAKVTQNPIHFDLTSTSVRDQTSSITDLIARGATHADVGQSGDEDHVVLADPEGNEFCVLAPGNRFLAGCPRLGAVNCDGTKELGDFFSAALGWPLVWDQDDETAIQAPTGDGPKVTWSGPPLMPKAERERIHFHLAPARGTSFEDATGELLRLGASRLDRGGAHRCPRAVPLADVDGNQFCLVE